MEHAPIITVWSFFRRAKKSGLWDIILPELVKKRLKAGYRKNLKK